MYYKRKLKVVFTTTTTLTLNHFILKKMIQSSSIVYLFIKWKCIKLLYYTTLCKTYIYIYLQCFLHINIKNTNLFKNLFKI